MVTTPLRVAPLFETLDDLDHSEGAMEQLLSNEWYACVNFVLFCTCMTERPMHDVLQLLIAVHHEPG